jgi:hypothetical protein
MLHETLAGVRRQTLILGTFLEARAYDFSLLSLNPKDRRCLFNGLPFLYGFLPATYFVFWRLKSKDAALCLVDCYGLRLLR